MEPFLRPRAPAGSTTSSIATHGRSLYVFDDATPIQQMTPERGYVQDAGADSGP